MSRVFTSRISIKAVLAWATVGAASMAAGQTPPTNWLETRIAIEELAEEGDYTAALALSDRLLELAAAESEDHEGRVHRPQSTEADLRHIEIEKRECELGGDIGTGSHAEDAPDQRHDGELLDDLEVVLSVCSHRGLHHHYPQNRQSKIASGGHMGAA